MYSWDTERWNQHFCCLLSATVLSPDPWIREVHPFQSQWALGQLSYKIFFKYDAVEMAAGSYTKTKCLITVYMGILNFKWWLLLPSILRNRLFPAILANKDVIVIGYCSHSQEWPGDPWKLSGRKEHLPCSSHQAATTPYCEPWGKKDQD